MREHSYIATTSATVYMFFKFRRRETPWEVVDNSMSVSPVPMYYEDEDLDIEHVGDNDTVGTYVFDVTHINEGSNFRNALLFSRQRLLQEVAKRGFNILVLESWSITILRKGKDHRLQVRYSGRPARTIGKLPSRRSPPFIDVLQRHSAYI